MGVISDDNAGRIICLLLGSTVSVDLVVPMSGHVCTCAMMYMDMLMYVMYACMYMCNDVHGYAYIRMYIHMYV